ncbi:MAG: hypothetical protein KDD61_16520 [Bdellovibrionales bacterium]|nr:hypothetical protein [Bdellovibrionales bacterium]
MKFQTTLMLILSAFLFTACGSKGPTKKEADQKSAVTKADGEKKDGKKEATGSDKKSADKKEMKTNSSAKSGDLMASCKLEKDERSIQIDPIDKGCTVMYTKFGDKKEVASSKWGMNHCQTVKDRIVQKLSDAGFKCQ